MIKGRFNAVVTGAGVGNARIDDLLFWPSGWLNEESLFFVTAWVSASSFFCDGIDGRYNKSVRECASST